MQPLGVKRLKAWHSGGQQFVAAPSVVGQVTAVAAAECTLVTLVGLLSGVRAHVGLQVALIRRGEGAQLTAVRLLPGVYADVLDEAGHALVAVAAVVALIFAVAGSLQTIHLDVWCFNKRQAHFWGRGVHGALCHCLRVLHIDVRVILLHRCLFLSAH